MAKLKEGIHAHKVKKRARDEAASDMGPSAPRTRLKSDRAARPKCELTGLRQQSEDAASVRPFRKLEASLAVWLRHAPDADEYYADYTNLPRSRYMGSAQSFARI